jgi:heavy metal sensor kinase
MLSLRIKLTLYYLAILTVILLVFGISIYWYLSRSLVMTIDETLEFQITKIERSMDHVADADIPDHPGNTAHEEQLLQISPHLTQLIDERGMVTDEMLATPQDRIPVEIDALMKLETGRTYFNTMELESGEPMRVATRRVLDHEGNGTYFIRLGQSLEALDIARKRLLLVLGLAIPAVLLLGSYGGLLLANQALRPVDRITKAAEQIGVAGDLSERVPASARMDEIGRLAATFNHMISRLQAAFERQKQFTSDASHELRTPLAVMRADIEITLRRERGKEEYQRVLTSNLEEIVRLSRLVEDLLMLARADAGKVELKCEPMDLDDLCRKMTEYILPLADQRDQTLTYHQPQGKVIISADMHRIKQLLLNLLDNAIKYTEQRGSIILGLKTEGDEAVLTVSDSGRGIPPEDLPHIFDRFFRRSAKTSDRSASGFGLGLSIVKWIVDSHAGKIVAQSEPGKGTTFIVRLPLIKEV